MIITHWKEQPVKENPHKVDVRALYNRENAQAMHITLQPGEQLKRHVTPVDVFFFVIEGTPTIEVGDEMMEVGENMLIESPKDIVHCIYNKSEKSSRILVVKAPRPISSARLL
ncbi:MAG: cupin domain-containing protein [Candidatus Moranbacteria bacterium]|nr:cupin domain-containing protein [Candidatus Moranbacteria bacterium]